MGCVSAHRHRKAETSRTATHMWPKMLAPTLPSPGGRILEKLPGANMTT